VPFLTHKDDLSFDLHGYPDFKEPAEITLVLFGLTEPLFQEHHHADSPYAHLLRDP